MLRGKSVKLRCKGCQHLLTVPADLSPPSGRTAATAGPKNGAPWKGLSAVASPGGGESPWFAILKGQQAGPFGLKELERRHQAGELNRRTYLWREGMADWKRAEELPELSSVFDPARGEDGEGEPTRRESFEQQPTETASRPLPGLKLSPELVASAAQAPAKPEGQPAAAPSGGALATAGEETRFFIAEAGVHRRNPPWKIAAFVAALIALPASVLYLLAVFKIGPLVITRIDLAGNEVRESVFSEPGSSALADRLSGRQQRARPSPDGRALHPPSKPAKAADPRVSEAQPPGGSADLRTFYADGAKADVGPAMRKSPERAEESSGGRAPAEVAKVVAQIQPAFQFCIEQEMKKNPSFKGGKVFVNAVIGGSGMVKQVAISRPDIDGSSLGECLKAKAKRMVFAASSGEDVEVQIPLILTTSL